MCMGRGWGVEGLVRLHLPSPLRVMVTQLTAAGPAPDHTAWAQKGLLGPTHAHGTAHCPTTPLRPPALSPKTGAWTLRQGCMGSVLGGLGLGPGALG